MLDPTDGNVSRIARDLGALVDGNFRLELDSALIYDGVRVLANALRHMDHMARSRSLNCSKDDNWDHGWSLMAYMRASSLRGLTGNIRFDNEGFRSDFAMDIVELSANGLEKVGTWNSTEGVNISRPTPPKLDKEGESLHNKSFIVLISLVG